MDERLALHTAARRYCRTQYDEWREHYQTLGLRLAREGRGAWVTDQVTVEELDVFPRFLVLQAILREVEKFDSDALPSLIDLRSSLRRIGLEATDQFVSHPVNEPGIPAMASERKRFNKYVASLSQRALAKVKPLPYLRVLADAEWKEHCAAIERLWSVKGHWYPLSGNNPPPHVLPFHTDYFDQEKVDLLRGILMDRRQHRVLSLRWSIGFEIELDSFEPSYKWSMGSRFLYGAGEEAFWTNPACDFLVYASHENSITIAGAWLVEAFERAMPGCRECTYLGELSTDDLRGLW